MKLVQIDVKLDDKLVERFRHVIYIRNGLKKGELKKALEEAMLDFIKKYENSKVVKEKAKKV